MKHVFDGSEELIAIAFGGGSSSSSSSSSSGSGVANGPACKSDVDSAMALGTVVGGAIGAAGGGVGAVAGTTVGALAGQYYGLTNSNNCKPKR